MWPTAGFLCNPGLYLNVPFKIVVLTSVLCLLCPSAWGMYRSGSNHNPGNRLGYPCHRPDNAAATGHRHGCRFLPGGDPAQSSGVHTRYSAYGSANPDSTAAPFGRCRRKRQTPSKRSRRHPGIWPARSYRTGRDGQSGFPPPACTSGLATGLKRSAHPQRLPGRYQ